MLKQKTQIFDLITRPSLGHCTTQKEMKVRDYFIVNPLDTKTLGRSISSDIQVIIVNSIKPVHGEGIDKAL